jgi:hypothetical protein
MFLETLFSLLSLSINTIVVLSPIIVHYVKIMQSGWKLLYTDRSLGSGKVDNSGDRI